MVMRTTLPRFILFLLVFIIFFVCVGFVSADYILRSSSATSSANLGDYVFIECDYGANLPCVIATHGAQSCSFVQYLIADQSFGTNAVFKCPVTTVGVIENYCNLFYYAGDARCNVNANEKIQSTTVAGVGLFSSSAPSSANLGDSFQIACNYGSANLPCAVASHGGVGCSFAGFSGTATVFNCQGKSIGVKENYCNLFNYAPDSRCVAQQNKIGNTNVINPNSVSLISSSAPVSANLGSKFEVKCDFGIEWLNCVQAKHGDNNCVYKRYEGTQSVWECTAANEGTVDNYCNLFAYSGNPMCSASQTNKIQSTTVTGAGLVSSSAPVSANMGSKFEMRCDFGIQWLNCVQAKHGNNNCVYKRYEGTQSVWECTAANAGTVDNYCNLFAYSGNPMCSASQTNKIQSTNVVICTPNCSGKVCGDNGCGGSCGTCSSGKTCSNGQCVVINNFVSVSGTDFYLDGKKFYFAGANAYYLWYGSYNCPAPDPNRGCSKEVLDDAKLMGLKVLRVWGFADGSNYWGSLQPQKGIYNGVEFNKFDRMIKEAKDRNIKLIIPLVNNWDDFGGMAQYNSWCSVSNHDVFYTNACTKQAYKNYVNYVLNRVNSLTGVKYKDEPTIMAWELANEPRCQSDKTGVTLNNWINEMSSYIKSIDSNHLVTTGIEGGYVNKGSDPYAWWYKGNEGQDYIKNHQLNNIDFATFHYYKDMDSSINPETWITEHIEDAHNIIKKPVVFEEFGKFSPRDSTFASFYNILEENGVNGNLFWMLKDKNYPDFDKYSVNYPEDLIGARIVTNANYMNTRNPYWFTKVVSGSHIEYRLYSKGHHYLSVINDGGVFDIRSHPGVDLDGWGSSLYLQPFFPNAKLQGTVIDSLTPLSDGIKVKAHGFVSQGTNSNYGTWNADLKFNYNGLTKEINGDGEYNINLNGVVNSNTGDLSLYKLASNYLEDVQLLSGGVGDTGDMKQANIPEIPVSVWIPGSPEQHYPQDYRNILTIEAVGDYNQINDARLKPAYKPSMKVKLKINNLGVNMIFGGQYDASKNKDPFADNVGMTPLIVKNMYLDKTFNIDVEFNSKAIAGDGSIK